MSGDKEGTKGLGDAMQASTQLSSAAGKDGGRPVLRRGKPVHPEFSDRDRDSGRRGSSSHGFPNRSRRNSTSREDLSRGGVPIMASSLPIPPQGMVYAQQVHQVQQQGAPYMPGNQGQPMMAAGGQYYGSSGDIQSQAMGQGMAATPIYFAYPATTQAQFAYSTQMAGSYHQAQMQGQQQ